MVDSITFNITDSKLIVTFEDGVSKEYTEATKDKYLADHPGRAADIVAMGWVDQSPSFLGLVANNCQTSESYSKVSLARQLLGQGHQTSPVTRTGLGAQRRGIDRRVSPQITGIPRRKTVTFSIEE